MKKTKLFKCILKVIIFTLIFSFLLSNVTTVLFAGVDRMSYNSVKGFYEEKKNTLDAVYIGSSNALAFWNPLLAWEEYGIAVSNLACNSQPIDATEFLIKEARRTQPNAVFVVNINTLEKEITMARLHRFFALAPFSFDKVSAIHEFGERYDLDFEERLELHLPIIKFHSRWNSLVYEDYTLKSNGYKGAISSKDYLSTSINVSEFYNSYDKTEKLKADPQEAVENLLDYCDSQKDLKIVFVTVPQAKETRMLGYYNTINKMVSDRGYPVLNVLENYKDAGINIEKDYYNNDHLNIHGSVKFTRYISEYLIENYGFENKKGNEDYASWDKGLEEYMKKANTALLDFQLDRNYVYNSLAEPENLKATPTSTEIALSWEPVENAQGYEIYEKLGANGTWSSIGTTKSTNYSDTKFESKSDYYYRVVPFKKNGDKKAYGDFSYTGIMVTSKKHS